MKIKELREKSTEELKRLLAENRENLREMYFKVSQRQLKKVRAIRNKKGDIARILTLLNSKEKSASKNKSIKSINKNDI